MSNELKRSFNEFVCLCKIDFQLDFMRIKAEYNSRNVNMTKGVSICSISQYIVGAYISFDEAHKT